MTTYKGVYLISRNPGLTVEQFPKRWRQHARLAATTRINAYITGVVQCSLARGLDFPAGAAQAFDGACLLDLRDRAAATDIWNEPEMYDVLVPDELLTFSRPVQESFLAAEEQVTREGPFTPFLLLRFVRRAPGLSQAEFLARWAEALSPLEIAGQTGGLVRRAAQNVIIGPPPVDFPFDLVTELWFDDLEAARRYDADGALQARLAAEREKLCDPARAITFLANVTHAYRAPSEAAANT